MGEFERCLKMLAQKHAHHVRIEVHAHGIEIKRMHEPIIMTIIFWDEMDHVDLVDRTEKAIAEHGLGEGVS